MASTMTTYKLTVHIHPDWVRDYKVLERKFCFTSCVVGADGPGYNVAAYACGISDTITVEWTEKYQIAASKTSFSYDEDRVRIFTEKPVDIELGQSYVVIGDRLSGPHSDAATPRDGFVLKTHEESAAVVYKLVNNTSVPVYISPELIPPGSKGESLVPKPKCMVWFSSRQPEPSDMVSAPPGTPELDFEGETSAEVWYTKDCSWSASGFEQEGSTGEGEGNPGDDVGRDGSTGEGGGSLGDDVGQDESIGEGEDSRDDFRQDRSTGKGEDSRADVKQDRSTGEGEDVWSEYL